MGAENSQYAPSLPVCEELAGKHSLFSAPKYSGTSFLHPGTSLPIRVRLTIRPSFIWIRRLP